LITFLLSAISVSLSGVMAPGPMTAATLTVGAERRHAGILIAVGHGLVEFPLMFLLMAGAGQFLTTPALRTGIGLVGGTFLVWMGIQLFRDLRMPRESTEAVGAVAATAVASGSATSGTRHPLWVGILFTAANPGFFLWWATIGLAWVVDAVEFGVGVCILFAAVHWLCDLIWYEVLTIGSYKGSELWGGRLQAVVLTICALVMLGFGIYFLATAGTSLFASLPATAYVVANCRFG